MSLDLTGRGILFDKDGTLFDFTASWAATSAAILRSLAAGDDARLDRMAEAGGFDMATETFHPSSIIIAGTSGEIYDVLSASSGHAHAHVRDVVDDCVAQAQMVAVAGLEDTLVALRSAGARLAVVTNDSVEAANLHLLGTGFHKHFDAIVGYDSGYTPKPAPGSCLGAASEIGIAPEHCVMVGDSTHDLEAGAAAGMVTIGVLTGVAQAATLAPLAASVLGSVAEVPGWLTQNALS